MEKECSLLINGKLVKGGVHKLPVTNPATGKVFVEVPRATIEHADLAVAAARRAFPAWAATSIETRRRAILRLMEIIATNSEELARSIVMEQGKPLHDARAEVERALTLARYYSSVELPKEVYRDSETSRVEAIYRPLGVVVGIVPWNYPFSLGMLKLIPATIMGNTFIWKPAPTTPVTTLLAGELIKDVYPPGVVNVIADSGDLGEYLTRHKDVASVSFIGSTATGKRVQEAGAPTLKRISLELGGNDAAIVLNDVDVSEVAEKIARSAFADAGQACVAVKRVYVPETIYDDLCTALADVAERVSVGGGFEQGSVVGPLQNSAQFVKAKEYLDVARRDGRVIAGGTTLGREGYFVKPTVVRDIEHDSRLVKEEQFAPILPVVKYANLDDAVRMANDSRYGLGGSVWSRDGALARDIAMKLEAGTVWINTHCDLPVDIPLRGAKESGIGADYGVEGLLEYTRISVINHSR